MQKPHIHTYIHTCCSIFCSALSASISADMASESNLWRSAESLGSRDISMRMMAFSYRFLLQLSKMSRSYFFGGSSGRPLSWVCLHAWICVFLCQYTRCLLLLCNRTSVWLRICMHMCVYVYLSKWLQHITCECVCVCVCVQLCWCVRACIVAPQRIELISTSHAHIHTYT
jgi:hypothetical protein